MPKNHLKLSGRLKTVAGFIEKGSCVADIGTDHGHIPVYLAQTGLAKRIIASDMSAGSLGAARRTAEKHSVADKMTFVVAPGLEGICETDVDTIVISGMGGETIIGILAAAPWTKRFGINLILQPQTKIDVLCAWLSDNGYIISNTEYAKDRGRTYTVFLVGANS